MNKEATPESYVEMKNNRLKDTEIAKWFGMSRPQLNRWKKKHGLKAGSPVVDRLKIDLTVIKYNEMKRMRMSDKEIADSLFISTATLSRWKQKNGVKAGRETEDYLKLKEYGFTDFQVSIQWDITPSALYQWKAKRDLVRRK